MHSYKHGEWKYYYENGQLQKEGRYLHWEKDGEWKVYHDNGKLLREEKFVNGEEEGTWKNYHENGQLYQTELWSQGKLMEIINCFDNRGNTLKKGNLKNGNGTVYYYDKTGELIRTIKYKNGIPK